MEPRVLEVEQFDYATMRPLLGCILGKLTLDELTTLLREHPHYAPKENVYRGWRVWEHAPTISCPWGYTWLAEDPATGKVMLWKSNWDSSG